MPEPNMEKTGKPIIYMDNRENGILLEQLQKLGADIKQKQLDVGDYILSDRVGIERKQIRDFIVSVINGRIFDQLSRLKNTYQKPVLVIEGNPELLWLENVHPNTIRGALASIAVDFGIPILWSLSQKETAGLIYWIAYREQIAEKREPAVRPAKKFSSMNRTQEYLIAGLPGISTVRARQLLKKFKTPRKVFAAKEKNLQKVPGIGEKMTKAVKEILDSEYRSE